MKPSPRPDKMRSAITRPIWILAAAGVSRDTTDDRSIPPPYSHFPPNRSANQPPGIYKQTKYTFHILLLVLNHNCVKRPKIVINVNNDVYCELIKIQNFSLLVQQLAQFILKQLLQTNKSFSFLSCDLFHFSYSTELLLYMFIEMINVDIIINAFANIFCEVANVYYFYVLKKYKMLKGKVASLQED